MTHIESSLTTQDVPWQAPSKEESVSRRVARLLKGYTNEEGLDLKKMEHVAGVLIKGHSNYVMHRQDSVRCPRISALKDGDHVGEVCDRIMRECLDNAFRVKSSFPYNFADRELNRVFYDGGLAVRFSHEERMSRKKLNYVLDEKTYLSSQEEWDASSIAPRDVKCHLSLEKRLMADPKYMKQEVLIRKMELVELLLQSSHLKFPENYITRACEEIWKGFSEKRRQRVEGVFAPLVKHLLGKEPGKMNFMKVNRGFLKDLVLLDSVYFDKALEMLDNPKFTKYSGAGLNSQKLYLKFVIAALGRAYAMASADIELDCNEGRNFRNVSKSTESSIKAFIAKMLPAEESIHADFLFECLKFPFESGDDEETVRSFMKRYRFELNDLRVLEEIEKEILGI